MISFVWPSKSVGSNRIRGRERTPCRSSGKGESNGRKETFGSEERPQRLENDAKLPIDISVAEVRQDAATRFHKTSSRRAAGQTGLASNLWMKVPSSFHIVAHLATGGSPSGSPFSYSPNNRLASATFSRWTPISRNRVSLSRVLRTSLPVVASASLSLASWSFSTSVLAA